MSLTPDEILIICIGTIMILGAWLPLIMCKERWNMQVIVHISEEAMNNLKNRMDARTDEEAIMFAVTFALDNY